MEAILQSSVYNKYPAFSPNQVLTDSQLNHLRDYLDQQNRLTRIRNIGSGIICGLRAWHEYEETQGQHFVNICEGFGITSSGFLLEFKPVDGQEYARYTYYRNYVPVDVDGDELEDNIWLQDLLETGEEVIELINLAEDQKGLGTSKQDPNQPAPIDKKILENRVLILLLKKAEEVLDPCVLTTCNNQGSNIAYTVTPILVKEEVLTQTSTEENELFTQTLHVPSLASGIKVGLLDNRAKVRDVVDGCIYSVLYFPDNTGTRTPLSRLGIAYGWVVEEMRDKIIDRVVGAYHDFKKLLNLEVDIDIIEVCLKDQLAKESDEGFTQYYYDYVRDLACAWNEFLFSLTSLNPSCFAKDEYPFHLTLGTFVRRVDDARQCAMSTDHRSLFEPSPTQNVMYGELEHCRKLYLRMIKMIGAFSMDIADGDYPDSLRPGVSFSFDINVTPSQTEHHPLGERAIPFYYLYAGSEEDEAEFESYWQPKMKSVIDPALSYYRLLGEAVPDSVDVFNNAYEYCPLYYSRHKHTFWRIEGHIGKALEVAVNELNSFRDAYNLEFCILPIYLNQNTQFPGGTFLHFENLMQIECGIIHTGGVQCGGTFILIIGDDGNVVADFSSCRCISTTEFQRRVIINPREDIGLEVAGETLAVSEDVASTRSVRRESARSVSAKPEKSKSKGKTSIDLSSRRAVYLNEIMSLNSKSEFSRNRTFQTVTDFLGSTPKSLNAAADALNEIIAKGTAQTNKKSTSQLRKVAYQNMIEKSWQHFADTVVSRHPNGVPKKILPVLLESVKDMANADISLKKLGQNWKNAEITSTPAGKEIMKLLK